MKYKILILLAFSATTFSMYGLTSSQAKKLIKSSYQGGRNERNLRSLCTNLKKYKKPINTLDNSGVGGGFKEVYGESVSEACERLSSSSTGSASSAGDAGTGTLPPPPAHLLHPSGASGHDGSASRTPARSTSPEGDSGTGTLPPPPARLLHPSGASGHDGSASRKPAISNKPLSKTKLEALLRTIRQRVEAGSHEDVATILRNSGHDVSKLARRDLKACHDTYKAAAIVREAPGAESVEPIDRLDSTGMQRWEQWIREELQDNPGAYLNLDSYGLNPADLEVLRNYAYQEKERLMDIIYDSNSDDSQEEPWEDDSAGTPGDLPPAPNYDNVPPAPDAFPGGLPPEPPAGNRGNTSSSDGITLTGHQRARVTQIMNETFADGIATTFNSCLGIALQDAGIRGRLSAEERAILKSRFDGDDEN